MLNYFVCEMKLVMQRWRLLGIYTLYFTVPVLFFQILTNKIVTSLNISIFADVFNAVFLIIFLAVLQFFVFNKISDEHKNGITATKFCMPMPNLLIILSDIAAEVFFGIILLLLCLIVQLFFISNSWSQLNTIFICAIILIPPVVTVVHAHTILFFSRTENVIIASVFSLASLLPMLFFISNIAQGISIQTNITLSLLYGTLITLLYTWQVAITTDNISL